MRPPYRVLPPVGVQLCGHRYGPCPFTPLRPDAAATREPWRKPRRCCRCARAAVAPRHPAGMPRCRMRRLEGRGAGATDTAAAGSRQQRRPLRAGTAGVLDFPAPSTPGLAGDGATSRSGSAQSPPQTPVVCASVPPSHGSPRRARPPQPPSDRPRTPPRLGASESGQRRAKYAGRAAAMSRFVMFSGPSSGPQAAQGGPAQVQHMAAARGPVARRRYRTRSPASKVMRTSSQVVL